MVDVELGKKLHEVQYSIDDICRMTGWERQTVRKYVLGDRTRIPVSRIHAQPPARSRGLGLAGAHVRSSVPPGTCVADAHGSGPPRRASILSALRRQGSKRCMQSAKVSEASASDSREPPENPISFLAGGANAKGYGQPPDFERAFFVGGAFGIEGQRPA